MFRTTLRSLWSHKRRLISTCVAVMLGVAFMAATFVLTGTINKVFDSLFADAYATTDATVRGEVLFESEMGDQRAPLREELLDEVRGVAGVAAAEPFNMAFTMTLLDHEGDPLGSGGAPTIVSSWVADDELNIYDLAEGRAPEAAGEAVVNVATAEDGGYDVGDDIELVTPDGRLTMELVGTARFGDAESAAGAVDVFATLPQVQDLLGQPGRLLSVEVRGDAGLSQQQVVDRITDAGILGEAEVITGTQAGEELSDDISSGLGFITTFLLIFALIALFVGAFIISNTFSILVAQRTKELALLRAIGATRRQVLASVMLEAGIIGLFSSLLGLAAGIGLGALAMAGLDALGLDLPAVGLAVEPTSVLWAVAAGLGITAIAAIMPAVRATRVAPMAALRDVAIDTSGRSRIRTALGLVALVAGVVFILPVFGADVESDALAGIGTGMALLVVAVLVLGPVTAKPLSRLVGSPLPALKGVTGRLARENAMRNPRRTASTASAIVIGVTLVVFITVFASSAQRSIEAVVDSGLRGDYIIQPVNQFTFSGVSPSLADELAALDGVAAVTASPYLQAQLTLPDGDESVSLVQGIDPATFPEVFDVSMAEGTLADLGPEDMVVSREWAEARDLAVGDQVEVATATPTDEDADATSRATFTIRGLTETATLVQPVVITREAAAELVAKPTDALLGLTLDPGTSTAEARAAIERVTDEYPTMSLQDRQEFTDGIVGDIKALLNVIYGLLGVSILIALIGIANTLSLSIHERTRELGLLRAMGMTRAQLRSSVRWEAVIVALIGTTIGLLLGLILSYALVRGLSSQGFERFEVPVGSLAWVVVAAALLGVVASLLPAFRASRLNVLRAIATE